MMASDGEYIKECTFASLPRTTRGLPLVISASPDGKKIVYCNGNSVYIREVENISDCEVYTEHAVATTVAKYSPSGFYIASGDQSGKVRIWDATQSTHILKAEYPVIAGAIRDIAWSDDSKRVAVVGEGRDKFGHVFLFDTGTSNGNLSGQSRAMVSVDFRPTRPYRLVSASEDNTVAIFEGPPFKFKTLFHEHTRFAHCVRYNKDGSLFASGGADGKAGYFAPNLNSRQCVHSVVSDPLGSKFRAHFYETETKAGTKFGPQRMIRYEQNERIGANLNSAQTIRPYTREIKVILFDGEAGGKVAELIDADDAKCKSQAHSGSIFSLAWSPDGNRIATASGDKTIKLWTVADRKCIATITFGTTIEDQQLAIVWLPKTIISVSLAGFISYVNAESHVVSKFIKGHNRPITALTVTADKTFAFTADFEGNITRWEISSGESVRLTPSLHKAQIGSMIVSSDGTLVSTGWDDTIFFTDSVTSVTTDLKPAQQKLSSQPRGVAATPDLSRVAVACQKAIIIFMNRKLSSSFSISYESSCVDVHPIEKIIAVGGQHGKVHIYEIGAGDALVEKNVLSHAGAITSVKFSPNGKFLVATDVARKVVPYDIAQSYRPCSNKDWSFHTARVNCCAWSANSRYVATGGLDTNIIVWDLQKSGEHPIIIKGAHSMNSINCVTWLTDKRILTAGQDSNLKQWTLSV